TAPKDVVALMARAKVMERENRHAEACALYEEALGRTWQSASKADILLRLALASYNAGNSENAVAWAEQAIALKPNAALATDAQGIAVVACSDQGLLDAAAQHYAQALDHATQTGNRERAANYMVTLASLDMKRGNLGEAMALCDQAASLSPQAQRLAYH